MTILVMVKPVTKAPQNFLIKGEIKGHISIATGPFQLASYIAELTTLFIKHDVLHNEYDCYSKMN